MTTWNSADKTASATLTIGDTVATCNSGATNQGVRSTTSHSSGKRYAEFHNNVFNAVGSPGGVGIADSSYGLTNGPGSDNTHSAWVAGGKGITVGNAAKLNGGIVNDPNGNPVGMAADIDADLIWFTTDGTSWNNGGTADPATGTGGYSLAGAVTLGPDVFLAAWLRWGVSAPEDTTKIIVAAADFTFATPSGFTAWDGVAGLDLSAAIADDTGLDATITITGSLDLSADLADDLGLDATIAVGAAGDLVANLADDGGMNAIIDARNPPPPVQVTVICV